MLPDSRIGFCCIALGLAPAKFRTTTLSWLRRQTPEDARERLFELYAANCEHLTNVLVYCQQKEIWNYRLTSDLFPMGDHPEFQDVWLEWATGDCPKLLAAKHQLKLFLEFGGRVSSHPSQYVSISSPNLQTRQNGIVNLNFHADFFDLLEIPQNYSAPINIHVSNGLNLGYFEYVHESFGNLNSSVKSRLVFETEDANCWTWQNLIKHFQVPITLDFHHRLINNLGEPESEAVEACSSTWQGFRPLFHYSEGSKGLMDRSHSDFVERLPKSYGTLFDLDVEAKKKDFAVLNLRAQNS